MSQNSQDSTVRTIGIVALGVIILALLYNVLLGGRAGVGFNVYFSRGVDVNWLLTSILALAVKLLWVVVVISLVAGLAILVKKNVLDGQKINLSFIGSAHVCPHCGAKLTDDYKFCPNCKTPLKEKCLQCGVELKTEWQCCPSCGTEKNIETPGKNRN